MATLSQEQYAKFLTAAKNEGVSEDQLKQALQKKGYQPPAPTYMQNVDAAHAERQQTLQGDIAATKAGTQSPITTAVSGVRQAVGGVMDYATNLPIVKPALDLFGKGVQALSETAPIQAIANSPIAQYEARPFTDLEVSHPEIAKNISNVAGTAMDVAGLKGIGGGLVDAASGVKSAVRGVADMSKKAGDVIKNPTPQTLAQMTPEMGAKLTADAEAKTISVVGELTEGGSKAAQANRGKMLKNTTYDESGNIKSGLSQGAADRMLGVTQIDDPNVLTWNSRISKLTKGVISEDNSQLENAANLNQIIDTVDESRRAFTDAYPKAVITSKDLDTALNAKMDETIKHFGGDSATRTIYQQLVDTFKNAVKDEIGTAPEGTMQARILDTATTKWKNNMRERFGSDFFDPATEAGKLRRIAAGDILSQARELIASRIQKGPEYLQKAQDEYALFRAWDNFQARAQSSVGKSKTSVVMDKAQKAAAVLGTTGGIAFIAGGASALPLLQVLVGGGLAALALGKTIRVGGEVLNKVKVLKMLDGASSDMGKAFESATDASEKLKIAAEVMAIQKIKDKLNESESSNETSDESGQEEK